MGLPSVSTRLVISSPTWSQLRSDDSERSVSPSNLYRCAHSEAVHGPFWEGERPWPRRANRAVRGRGSNPLAREYVDAVVSAKDRGLPVLLGLEVDFFPDTIAVLELIEPYPWDLLIGSVHRLGGWSLDHPEVVHEFRRRGVRQAYEDYFAAEAVLAASGTVDILAHVDLIKVFGHRLDQPPIDLCGPVVRAAANPGTAVEVNTSGIDGPAGEVYPSPVLLQMFNDAGVLITIGSNAHGPEDVGRCFDTATRLAVESGYVGVLEYRGRNRTEVPLQSPTE